MNTPKREDIEKEMNQVIYTGWMEAIKFFQPLVNIMSLVSRYGYLVEEKRKITPVPKPEIVPDAAPVANEVKVEEVKENV